MSLITKEKQKSAYEALKGELHYKNALQTPRLLKVILSAGVGSMKDKNKIKVVEDRLARISGQKALNRGAKKSIASFKVRQGDTVGFQVTLRGARMYDFLDKLIHVALPRTRDFRGLSPKAIDAMGNFTLGIRESNIFPEVSEDDLKDVFSFAITIVTTAKNPKEAESFLRHIGFPLKK